jgi:hypothetical protein
MVMTVRSPLKQILGVYGWKEYLTSNRPMKEIPGLELIDIPITLKDLED